MVRLWGMRSTLTLLLLPAPLWPGMVALDSPLYGAGSHSAGILSPTDSNSNWNWFKPFVAPGYIIVLHPPASAVPPLIYTGASLDWQLGRGPMYNSGSLYLYVYINIIWFFCFFKNLFNPPRMWLSRDSKTKVYVIELLTSLSLSLLHTHTHTHISPRMRWLNLCRWITPSHECPDMTLNNLIVRVQPPELELYHLICRILSTPSLPLFLCKLCANKWPILDWQCYIEILETI